MKQVLKTNQLNFRTGFGVDVHQLVEGRPLIIGGVKIESNKGALGHSDADVLIHAICDALLGAANLRDIGFHFSDQDDKYKDIDSTILLCKVKELLYEKGFLLGNLDATVMLESPKLSPHIPLMQSKIAEIMGVDVDLISIKATTSEKLGFVGTQDGIKAYCTVLIYKS